jgi:hypothetical protein
MAMGVLLIVLVGDLSVRMPVLTMPDPRIRRDPCRSVGENGDPLDLHQLTGVAEDRHAEQHARWAMGSEPAGHRVPHPYEFVMTADHRDDGLHQV